LNGQALQAADGASPAGPVFQSIDGRRWQVQWCEPSSMAAPAAKPPFPNRAPMDRAAEFQLVVPDGQVFVLGDNRLDSTDSRSFGTVPMQDILGRARQVWFSSDKQGVRWSRLGRVLE
jgi:signal peptidase I